MNDDIRGYRCPNCGAMIPVKSGRVLKCECCGSEFERTRSDLIPYQVVTFEGEDIVIGTRISQWEMDETFRDAVQAEDFLEYKLNEMARKLATSIMPYIEVVVHEDLERGGMLIRGKVRIGKPTRPLGKAQISTLTIQDRDFEVR